MKPLRLQFVMVVLVCALGISGCTHKKPVLVVPQQPPATAAPEPTPTPEPAASQPAEQPQEAQPEPTPADQTPATSKNKPKNGRHPVAKKPSPVVTATGEKPSGEVARNTPPKTKVVQEPKVENPPVQSGQIAPGPTPANTTNDQASTDQLLQNAESNLNGIKRQLNADEEAMRVQIREFITQSHKAITENDPQRAHILAVKARLLSEELIKRR
jgi:outer membrane biosynthesis protein TonB